MLLLKRLSVWVVMIFLDKQRRDLADELDERRRVELLLRILEKRESVRLSRIGMGDDGGGRKRLGTLVDHLRCACWWYFAWCAPCINTTVQERIGPRYASMAFRAARERDPEGASKCKPLRTCRRHTNQPCALITLANSRPMNRPINPARYLSEHHQRVEMGSDTSTRLKRSLYVIPLCCPFLCHSTTIYLRWPCSIPRCARHLAQPTGRRAPSGIFYTRCGLRALRCAPSTW